MAMVTRQIGPCFAAEVDGLDLAASLSAADVAAIHAVDFGGEARPDLAGEHGRLPLAPDSSPT